MPSKKEMLLGRIDYYTKLVFFKLFLACKAEPGTEPTFLYAQPWQYPPTQELAM